MTTEIQKGTTMTEYEMTQEDLDKILKAGKPVVCLIGSGGSMPSGPQENANRAWESLGSKMGFEPMTVRPIQGKGDRFFIAKATT